MNRQSPLARFGLPLVATTIGCVPRPWRFRATIALSDAITWTLRSRWRLSGVVMDSDRDIALGVLLTALDRRRLLYRPRIVLDGVEAVSDALATGRGALLAGVHNAVVHFAAAALDDIGIPVLPVAGPVPYRCRGTDRIIPSVDATAPQSLVRIRSALRRGELVGALIDVDGSRPRSVAGATTIGELRVMRPILDIAARVDAAVVCISAATRRDGTVHIRFRRLQVPPPASGEAYAQALVAELARQIDELVVTGRRSVGRLASRDAPRSSTTA